MFFSCLFYPWDILLVHRISYDMTVFLEWTKTASSMCESGYILSSHGGRGGGKIVCSITCLIVGC